MSDVTAPPTVDLGRGLQAVLRSYLEGARDVIDDLPGGPRGFQVMSMAADAQCSNQASMARSLGVDRTVMTYLIDDLEEAGLVERRSDPADRRARQVVVTDAGRGRLAAATDRLAAVEARVLAALTTAESDTFRELLQRVADTSEHTPDACSAAADVPTC